MLFRSDVARVTPLETAAKLSARLGNTVLLKREDLQPVHSFKLRGAFNKIVGLSAAERAKGVICASAGNHGQGVAYSCAELGIGARVYVPGSTPRQKRQRILALGRGQVELIVADTAGVPIARIGASVFLAGLLALPLALVTDGDVVGEGVAVVTATPVQQGDRGQPACQCSHQPTISGWAIHSRPLSMASQ